MPTIPIDWNKVQMHNWVQYNSQVDQVRVRLNIGKIPTIEFLPSPVEGDDPFELFVVMVFECINVILKLNDTMGLRVGPLQLGSRGEWVVYDPVASAFCKMNGQVTYEGVAKVNASRPRAIGEFEFFDPRALLNYLLMPPRLKKVESITEKIWEGVQKLGQSKLFTYSNRVPMSSNSLGFTAWSIVPMSIF